jgi:hypothetical protein
MGIDSIYLVFSPTDGVSNLSWWWGLSAAPETLRAMPAVA